MARDPFYVSKEWLALRAAAIRRDGRRCTVPGCGSMYRLTVDHIVSRRKGGPDTLANLRTLCITHDNQAKQDQHGNRRSGGRLTVKGCDAAGMPLDPLHPWSIK